MMQNWLQISVHDAYLCIDVSAQPNEALDQRNVAVDGCQVETVVSTVVGEGHHGGDVALGVLGDDAEAGEGAPLAGDVERRVAAVVGQTRVAAGLQEPFHQLGLLCDHRQVEGSLEGGQKL